MSLFSSSQLQENQKVSSFSTQCSRRSRFNSRVLSHTKYCKNFRFSWRIWCRMWVNLSFSVSFVSFFLYSLVNLLCRQPVSSFRTILLTHCVDGNTWTPFTPEHIKKQDSHQVLATSICFSVFFFYIFICLFFLPSFSFVIRRLLLLCHEDIFWEEKRPRMFTMSSTLKHLR